MWHCWPLKLPPSDSPRFFASFPLRVKGFSWVLCCFWQEMSSPQWKLDQQKQGVEFSTQPSDSGCITELFTRDRPTGDQGLYGAGCGRCLLPLARVLMQYVSLQAQSSACSLQAELEKLRLAENAAASDTEEAQHLKVIWLPCCHVFGVEPRHQKPCLSGTVGRVYHSWGWWGKQDSSLDIALYPRAGCELRCG